jgi:hypothetical protein
VVEVAAETSVIVLDSSHLGADVSKELTQGLDELHGDLLERAVQDCLFSLLLDLLT